MSLAEIPPCAAASNASSLSVQIVSAAFFLGTWHRGILPQANHF
jgi:hypothetical protein